MGKIVEVKNLKLIYHSKDGETEAIKNISFSINEGEFVAIVGPSGCGKTTILSILSGLLKASDGTVLIENTLPNPKSNITGYMFQKDNLFSWRTIEKNVCFGLEIQKVNTKERCQYAINLLKKYGLGEFLKKRPDQLSGGMRQRVALIRTLALKPKVLLLDEPFSALDYQTRLNVCNDVSKIIENEKKTAILVTHDIQEAISMADKIIVLSKRPAEIKSIHNVNLKKYGTPFQRRYSPEFSNLFETIWKEIQNEKENAQS